MKAINSLFLLSTGLLTVIISSHASVTTEPQLYPQPNQKTAILQVPLDKKDDVMVKVKSIHQNIIMEIAVDDDSDQYKTLDFSSLKEGTYYLDIYHDGVVTRKELDVRWDGIEVTRVEKMKRDPFHQYFFNYIL